MTRTSWVLRFDTGQSYLLRSPVLLGRAPTPKGAYAGAELVNVQDPSVTVSNTHLAAGPDERGVWICDLGSMNGTAIISASGRERTLAAGVRAIAPAGARVRIGDRYLQVAEAGQAGGPRRAGAKSASAAEQTLDPVSEETPRRPVYGRAVTREASVDIVGTVVIGRAPAAIRGEDCRLLRVASPERTISRSHVVLRVANGVVTARDLGSHNGTMLCRAGRTPERVGADQPSTVHDGDVLDLGEGVRVVLAELP